MRASKTRSDRKLKVGLRAAGLIYAAEPGLNRAADAMRRRAVSSSEKAAPMPA